jgi:hypothetical protein
MVDETEDIRRARVAELNSKAAEVVKTAEALPLDAPNQDPKALLRTELETEYGKCWDTQELSAEFEVTGFMAPLVVVKRKSDGVMGSLEFTHSPRFYFNFVEDKR